MSFESEYLKALYGTSKKKKKEEESFESQYEAELKNATGDTIEDIAPVRSKESGGGRSGSFRAYTEEEQERMQWLEDAINTEEEFLGYEEDGKKVPLLLQALQGGWILDIFGDGQRVEARQNIKDWKAELERMRSADYLKGEDNDTTEKKDKWYEGWVKGGGLSDGYQFGDIITTGLATIGDTAIGVAQGAGNMLEGISDLILHGGAKVADWTGLDSVSNYLDKEADSETINKLADGMRSDTMKQFTLWGEKGQGIPQGVGQMFGLGKFTKALKGVGLGVKAISALVTTTMGASSMGSGISEARNSDNEKEALYNAGIEVLDKQLADKKISQADYDTAKAELDEWWSDNEVSDTDAWKYGFMKGSIDAGSELLFGGMGKGIEAVGFSSGLGGFDDILAKKSGDIFGKFIKNKTAQRIVVDGVEYVIKAGGEGLEEVVAAHGTAVAKKLSYMSDEELSKLIDDEDALTQFLTSFVVSGVMQGGDLVNSIKTDTDFVTGLTNNEQSVVDKEIEKRIAEEEKAKGRKLSISEKNKITETVKEDLDKGYISIDTIEEVLGGESLKSYRDAVAKEDALKADKKAMDDEFNKLNRMKKGDMTGEQSDRLEELRAKRKELELKIAEADKTSQRDSLKSKYQSEVFEIAKGSRLAESYREGYRRTQHFETDVSKYKGKAKQTIENLINSKSANNTNRSHEFAETLAKYSEDQDVVVEFTSNAQLRADRNNHKLLKNFKANGKQKNFDLKMKNIDDDYAPVVTVNGEVVNNYKVDYKNGKITFDTAPQGNVSVEYRKVSLINGYRKGNKIVLNMDSPQAWTFTVGHEVTHKLEGTKEYNEYRKAIIEYAKKKGDYDSRYESRKGLYNEGTDIDGEITADLTGEYILNDVEFINNLTTNHQNIAQKIYNEIKHMLKLVTAGSKEARQLERAKHNFEKAYRAKGDEKGKSNPNIQHSLVEDQETIDFLENQEYLVVYKAMQVKDGKLYPPMSAEVEVTEEYTDKNGETKTRTVRKLKQPSVLGKWQKSDERPDLITKFAKPTKKYPDGYGKFDLLKGTGNKSDDLKGVAYNPYEHTSNIVMNDQFSSAYRRDNLVTVEYHIPKSELTSGYKAQYAKDPVGLTDWKAGGVAQKLKNSHRDVYLTRWAKPVRVLSDAEVAQKYKEILDKEDGISIPWNVVTPSLLSEMQKIGVPIDYSDVKFGSAVRTYEAAMRGEYSDPNNSDDSQYSLTEEQEEYFKDSVVRDDNGNLKVMYHGTSQGGHTVFDTYGSNYGLFGTGSYFTDNKDIAESYTKKGKGNSPQVYESYLNITNPMDMDAQADPTAWAEAFPDAMFPESGTNEDYYRAMEEYFEDNEYSKGEASEMAMDALEEMGYDGITHIGGGRVNPDGTRHQVYIAFHPEQIKDINNAKPTSNPDIQYSLTEYTEEQKKEHNKIVLDHFGKTYKWAETGYLLLDGTKLDLSGKHDGAPGGYRTVDHRDITEALGYDYGGDGYSDSLVQFMSEGNIRIIPEVNGINLSVQPTSAQEKALAEYVSRFRGEVVLDIDDLNGRTVASVEYPVGTSSTKVLNDIRGWFENGTKPEVSSTSQFRYSLSDSDSNTAANEQETNEKLNNVGLRYDAQSETVSYSMSSLDDIFHSHRDENGAFRTEMDYIQARDEYVDALAKSIALDKGNPTEEEIAKANRYLDSLFLIHDMIAQDREKLDYEAAVDKSAWVSNAEYGGSIDFSTLCAKRRLFTGTFDAIQNALPDTVLNENDFLRIRNMLLEKELESPCSMCYVEGSRAKHGEYVAKFLKDYLATNPEWRPQIADFTSTTRLEQTRINHPEAYKAYQDAMNKLAQRKPKEASVRTDYKGEILVAFADGSSVEIKNKNGGIRFNSFSDFEIIHALDCMQVLTDMARVGLSGQAYTKVKEFAECFGNTGLKINLSLVAKDVDANGKLIMDETNGMKYAEAMDIRNRYSENVGTVIVVFNDAQLKAALADNTIDYVLPFHRSQWKKSQYAMMGLPTQTRDYTMVQNDRTTNPNTGKPVKLSKLKKTTTYTNDITGETFEIKDNIMPNQYWDFSKSGRENAQRYLDYINANGMTPKFDSVLKKVDGKWVLPEGAIGDGYYKLLIDFKMYDNDGWGSPQKPVVPEFNMPYIQKMLEDYKGGHQAFPVAHDVVDAFVEGKKNGQFSLTDENDPYGRRGTSLRDLRVEDVAPTQEEVAPVVPTENEQNVAQAPAKNVQEKSVDDLRRQMGKVANEAWELDKKKDRTEAETLEMQRLYKQVDAIQEEIFDAIDREHPDAIYNLREGESGWGNAYGTANEALHEAVRKVNGELWTAFNEEVDNSIATSNVNTPILDAISAVEDDVRQEAITPIQGAKLLNKVYSQGGVEALKKIVNRANGTIYPQALERAKKFSTEREAVNSLPDEYAPMVDEKAELEARIERSNEELEAYRTEFDRLYREVHQQIISPDEYLEKLEELKPKYTELWEGHNRMLDEHTALEKSESARQRELLDSLTDEDAPPEIVAPYYESLDFTPDDPFSDRDIKAVGNKKVKAYMYENPEVKPFFQSAANAMLGDLRNSTKGERVYHAERFETSIGGEGLWDGVKRNTTADIAYLLDECHYTYAEIQKGLEAIIEDNGAENNAASKRIEFFLNDRLLNGYEDIDGYPIPPDQNYINLLNEKQITEYNEEARKSLFENADAYAPPTNDIAPVVETAQPVEAERYEAIRPRKATEPAVAEEDIAPIGENVEYGDRLVRTDSPEGKERKWVGTSTESETVNRQILPDDLDQKKIYYEPISNKKTLGNANAKLDGMGYEASVQYFNSQFKNKNISLDDVALGERLIQEALKRGDTKTAGELIENVAILGTELGQKVQALSIIKRLTPEGQLKMLQKTVERGKTKGDKAFEGVEITQEMIDKILKLYSKDGTYDQKKLNEAVEEVKKDIADQMKVTKMDKVNAWRYLSMLGNPKTHIRNLVSNVAMKGTVAVKNAVARTIESVAPIENRTKTWKSASADVKAFAQKTTAEMKETLSDGGKYSEDASIKSKRQIFKNKVLNGIYEFNSDMLSKEDWWFSKPAFTSALSEYLTANGITTAEDIKNNPKVIEKAKLYATEQSQIATFRQYSWLANQINEIERTNTATQIAVGAVLPFKKTPINIAKTGLAYSPLGFTKTLTYDVAQVKNGKMEASELVDHLSQNVTGSALTLVGYLLASTGFISGGGDDDKEGEYDYQLGEQSYSINIGGQSYSLSWLSPVAMPLFVGANAYEQLVEGKEWNGDVVVETLAQTLDPLSEMSFLSGLNQVLSSYDSGIQKFAGIGEAMAQNYITQFVPTLSSQVAATMDDTKRSTKVAADSDFRFFDQIVNQMKYKIPGLRQTLEPSTDIWGNEIKQTDNVALRAFETFIAPYARREDIATEIDAEIKSLYSLTGDDGVIPSIPRNTLNYKDAKYEMSASDYTAFKKTYGQTAYDLMEGLFATEMYQNASDEEKADLVGKVYSYASDVAKKEYLAGQGVEYTNAKKENEEYYREDAIKGAIEYDMTPDEYSFYVDDPNKHAFLKEIGVSYSDYASADEDGKRAYTWAYKNPDKYKVSKVVSSDVVQYRQYTSAMNDITGENAKDKKIRYIDSLDLDYGQKMLLFKMEYPKDDSYNEDIVQYLNNRADISYSEMVEILTTLGFTVKGNTVYWD